MLSPRNQRWRDFIEGEVYTDAAAPWRDDAAFALIADLPGLRDGIGGRTGPALVQAIGLAHALAHVDLVETVHTAPPAQGLCLGFGMNALEPYDLLRVFQLDCVHAYEWIGAQVIEAAQTLHTLRIEDPLLPSQIRLHHAPISDLGALAAASMQIIYTANVFTREVPMTAQTFTGAVNEIVRVLAPGGILLSRGSAGELEERLASHGSFLLHIPLIAVFVKQPGD